jgi:hypothetical protein
MATKNNTEECKYGSKCYRKNEEHLKRFHADDDKQSLGLDQENYEPIKKQKKVQETKVDVSQPKENLSNIIEHNTSKYLDESIEKFDLTQVKGF